MINQDILLNNKPLLQNVFEQAKKDQLVNRIYLVNAIRLEAALVDHDSQNLLISNRDNGLTLVYLHAVASFAQSENPANLPDFKRNSQTVEEAFFRQNEQDKVNVYLINGIKLTGKVIAFDNDALLMHSTYRDKNEQLRESSQVIMKKAIASVSLGY